MFTYKISRFRQADETQYKFDQIDTQGNNTIYVHDFEIYTTCKGKFKRATDVRFLVYRLDGKKWETTKTQSRDLVQLEIDDILAFIKVNLKEKLEDYFVIENETKLIKEL